jgi:steroid delta-isomerase-like uncharacterized protein
MKLKSILLAGVVGLGLTSVALPSLAAGRTEAHKALVRRVFEEVLDRGRYQAFQEICAKDFVKHVDRHDSSLAEEVGDAKSMRSASSDLVMTVDRMIAEGDSVAVLYAGRGTSTGPLFGMPATGKTFVVTGMTLYRIPNGTIGEEWTFYNTTRVLRKFGYREGPGARWGLRGPDNADNAEVLE